MTYVRMSADFVAIKHDIPQDQEVFIVHGTSTDASEYPPSKSFVVYVETREEAAKAKAYDLMRKQDFIASQMVRYRVDKYTGGNFCSMCVEPRKGGPYDADVWRSEFDAHRARSYSQTCALQ